MADPAVVASTFATNVLGPFNVVEAFLPLLRKSGAGRIVNVSSRVGSLAEQADPASALLLDDRAGLPGIEGFAEQLQHQPVQGAGRHPIVVTSVCPGFVQTDLTPVNRNQAPTTPEQAAQVVLTAATLPAGAASGTFIDAD